MINGLAPGSRQSMILVATFLGISTVVVTEYTIWNSAYSIMLFLLAIFLPALGIVAIRHRPETPPRPMLIAAGAFCALMVMAVISGAMTTHLIGNGPIPGFLTLSKAWILPVPIQAAAICLMAFLAVSLVRSRDLSQVLWWFAMAGLIASPVGWAIIWMGGGITVRLATRVGGAAVIHVALLLGLAICLAAWRRGYRPRVSLAGAALYALYIMLTQARGGLVALGAFAVLLAAPRAIRAVRAGRFSARAWIISAAVVAALVAITRYILTRRDFYPLGDGRLLTWLGAWKEMTSSVGTFLIGTGYGELWPWMALERGDNPQSSFHQLKDLPHGQTLAHAHNVYIGIAAELGLVGLALFAVVVAVMVWLYRRAATAETRILSAALMASLAAFVFDSYLIKNFPLSFIWWSVLFALTRMVTLENDQGQPESPPAKPAPGVAAAEGIS